VQRAILFDQGNEFHRNIYRGTWRFTAFDQAPTSIRSLATWSAMAPEHAVDTYALWSDPPDGIGQDSGSVKGHLPEPPPPPTTSTTSTTIDPSTTTTVETPTSTTTIVVSPTTVSPTTAAPTTTAPTTSTTVAPTTTTLIAENGPTTSVSSHA
jgi:hypothetical protein